VRALRAELSRVAAATEYVTLTCCSALRVAANWLMHGNYRKAQGSWERFKAERDTHRMHHRRVAQEKNKLITDLKRLQKVCAGSFVLRWRVNHLMCGHDIVM